MGKGTITGKGIQKIVLTWKRGIEMIKRYYECTCDYCGSVINHYPDIKPSKGDFEEIGAVVSGRKIFCDKQCLENYRHD